MTTGESWDVDSPVKSLQRLHHCRRCSDPSVNLLFYRPLTPEQDPEMLELLHLGKRLSP